MHMPIRRKLFLSHFMAVLLVSGSLGTYFYLTAIDSLMNSLQGRLKNSAVLISQALEAKHLEDIRGPADTEKPAYLDCLKRLREFKHSNRDISFLYIMRLEGDRVVFVVDSDETDGQALPGRAYEWDVPGLRKGFSAPSVDRKLYTDEWGSFMSGYAPLRNGQERYLLGMDMRADEVAKKLRNLRISGFFSLLCSIFLAFFFAVFLSRHFNRRIRLLTDQCSAIGAGRLGETLDHGDRDEFDGLIRSFSTMSSQLAESRDENRAARWALEVSRGQLETKVSERTADLERANAALRREIDERRVLSGLLPICASCKKIRDDKGYWNQLEAYIKAHSMADFSHGLCPECAESLYPECYDKGAAAHSPSAPEAGGGRASSRET